MHELLRGLTARLREADTFGAVAAAAVETLAGQPGVRAVAVEGHDRDGPHVWFATAGFSPPAGYLEAGRRGDPLLAHLRPVVEPWSDGPATCWLCSIVGCGEVVGVIRLLVDAGATVAPVLAQVCTVVSIRVAQLGGTGDDINGAAALTARQYEVTVLVARGSTNAEIARLLSISPDAVKKHVSRALLALEVSNRTELAAIAGRWRCVTPAVPTPALHIERRPRARTLAPRSRAA